MKTRVAIVLDCSGSMQSIRSQAVDLYNQTLNELKSKFPPHTEATLVYFGVGVGGRGCQTVYRNVPLSNLNILSLAQFQTNGWTPLYDGLAQAIFDIQSADPEMSYGVWMISDGAENSSSGQYKTPDAMRKLILAKQGTDCWTFACLIHRDHVGHFRALGAVPEGNIQAWGDINEATVSSIGSVGTYAALRATGVRSSRAVFTSDLSGVTKGDLSRLKDITHEVKSWKVDKGIRIDHFLNAKSNGGFKPGINFYQLQKSERVQTDKEQFIICEKGTKAFYVADRAFFGMPPGEIRLNPGNHANYDIWVMSSSNNRNLLAGSRVIVWPNAKQVAVRMYGVPGQP